MCDWRLGCSQNAPTEFTALECRVQAKSNFRTLNSRKKNLQLFKALVSRTPWEPALRSIGDEQNWQTFRDLFHRDPKILVPRCNKSEIQGTCMVESRHAEKIKGQEGNVQTGERYPRKSRRMQSSCLRMEWGRPRWSQSWKSQRMQTLTKRTSTGLSAWKQIPKMCVALDEYDWKTGNNGQRLRYSTTFYASVFNNSLSSCRSQGDGLKGRNWGSIIVPSEEEDQI